MQFRLAACATACVITVLSPASARDLSEPEYAKANAVLLERYVLPRVDVLARSGAALLASVEAFCKARNANTLKDAVSRFDAAFDAWIQVRHLAFGPFEFFLRGNRFQYAPDPGHRVARDLDALLRSGNAASLGPAAFRDASVTVQGFPALEILLYDPASREALHRDGKEEDFRCGVERSIARNLAEMGAGVAGEWRGGKAEPFIHVMTHPRSDNPFYQTHRDVTLQFFKNLYSGLDLIADVKIAPVLGSSLSGARPALEESPASGHSLVHIVSSLESLEALYTVGLEGLLRSSGNDPDLVPLLPHAFRITIGTARGIKVPLSRAVTDPAARGQVEKLLLQVRALKQLVSRRLSAATGLVVGFNALDGD